MTDSELAFSSLAGTPNNFCGIVFAGTGSAMPSQRLTNDQIGMRVDTDDSWIKSRTGIGSRHVVGSKETLVGLSHKAGAEALKMAGWNPESIDLVLLATSTPDDLFGSAPQVQAQLGAINAVAFDLTAACSGFLFALVTAAQYLRVGSMKRVLVIGADQLTRWVDWDDRRSCVLFGDGAGAIALEASPFQENDFIDFQLKTDGMKGKCLNLPCDLDQISLVDEITYQKGGFSPIQMNGQEVYKFAVKEVPLILQNLLSRNSIDPKVLDWLVLHQANQRILNAVAERFDIPSEKVLSNLSNYGNTSAATIPVVFDEAVRDGRIQKGNLIASSGFGAGLSWGAALFRWRGPV